MSNIKIDFHVHSFFSNDSNLTIKDIVGIAKTRDLQGVFICDHDSFEMKKYLKGLNVKDFFILNGMEIKTEYGEIISCFHTEEIESRRYQEVLDEIRDKNGYIIVPHPLDVMRKSHLKLKYLIDLIKNHKDILLALEVLNSRCILNKFNKKSLKLAEKHGIGRTAGSDAHYKFEIGNSYIILENVNDENDIFNAIRRGKTKIAGKLSSPFVHILTIFEKSMKKYSKKLLGKNDYKNFIPV
ncbi:MAG: PHP domain-containing protein [Candidatus Helarchaeota archaeon]